MQLVLDIPDDSGSRPMNALQPANELALTMPLSIVDVLSTFFSGIESSMDLTNEAALNEQNEEEPRLNTNAREKRKKVNPSQTTQARGTDAAVQAQDVMAEREAEKAAAEKRAQAEKAIAEKRAQSEKADAEKRAEAEKAAEKAAAPNSASAEKRAEKAVAEKSAEAEKADAENLAEAEKTATAEKRAEAEKISDKAEAEKRATAEKISEKGAADKRAEKDDAENTASTEKADVSGGPRILQDRRELVACLKKYSLERPWVIMTGAPMSWELSTNNTWEQVNLGGTVRCQKHATCDLGTGVTVVTAYVMKNTDVNNTQLFASQRAHQRLHCDLAHPRLVESQLPVHVAEAMHVLIAPLGDERIALQVWDHALGAERTLWLEKGQYIVLPSASCWHAGYGGQQGDRLYVTFAACELTTHEKECVKDEQLDVLFWKDIKGMPSPDPKNWRMNKGAKAATSTEVLLVDDAEPPGLVQVDSAKAAAVSTEVLAVEQEDSTLNILLMGMQGCGAKCTETSDAIRCGSLVRMLSPLMRSVKVLTLNPHADIMGNFSIRHAQGDFKTVRGFEAVITKLVETDFHPEVAMLDYYWLQVISTFVPIELICCIRQGTIGHLTE
jgi:chemotaxis protein histidine kinase CheA